MIAAFPLPVTFTATEKAECARREVAQRRRVYAKQIERGHMTEAFAARQIALMEAIVADYEAQAQKERLI